MDWAILISLVVTGMTAGSLWWWRASEVANAGRDDSPREVTTPSPPTTPRDIIRSSPWGPETI